MAVKGIPVKGGLFGTWVGSYQGFVITKASVIYIAKPKKQEDK